MKFEFFIAQRLRLGNNKSGTPSLNLALVGIVLAIVVMILSITIIMGFKNEITTKIYSLEPHLKITNAQVGLDNNYSTVKGLDIFQSVMRDSAFLPNVASMSLIAEKPAILKTPENFKAIQYRGVGSGYDWDFLKKRLIDGRIPNADYTAGAGEVIISQMTANQLGLKVGDKVLTYFIENKVKVRNSKIVGIYSTDFDTFDRLYIIGNISLLQEVSGWDDNTGTYVGVNIRNVDNLNAANYQLYSLLAKNTYEQSYSTLYNVTNTRDNNQSFFTWLGMLDMNVIIILVLMIIVSSFTLISALLMIVLERINMVGLLKAMGANNGSIRSIFIYLTQKLIIKAIIIGNIVGLGLAFLQYTLHIVRLDPDAYYMPFVPISFDWMALLALNVAIIIISYITLLAPSFIISSIKPTTTMRFE